MFSFQESLSCQVKAKSEVCSVKGEYKELLCHSNFLVELPHQYDNDEVLNHDD